MEATFSPEASKLARLIELLALHMEPVRLKNKKTLGNPGNHGRMDPFSSTNESPYYSLHPVPSFETLIPKKPNLYKVSMTSFIASF